MVQPRSYVSAEDFSGLLPFPLHIKEAHGSVRLNKNIKACKQHTYNRLCVLSH